VELGAHAAFIVTAYLMGVFVILSLIAWIVADYRTQQRILAGLERDGVARRSASQSRKAA
jgi:heme exporter protein CcmD